MTAAEGRRFVTFTDDGEGGEALAEMTMHSDGTASVVQVADVDRMVAWCVDRIEQEPSVRRARSRRSVQRQTRRGR